MTITEEGWHILPDGTSLYTKTWKPDTPPKAILAFVHGFSDHCNAYYDFFPALTSYGIEVRAFDQRGWGRSVTTPATRGLTGSTAVVLSDIHSFLTGIHGSLTKAAGDPANDAQQDATSTTPPVFLMGHSMGGAEALYYMLKSPLFEPWIRGVLAYAPLIELHPSTRPWQITVVLGKLAGKLLPRFQLPRPLDASLMCRDERVCEDWKKDSLCHDTGTLEGMAGLLERGGWLNSLKSGVEVPLKRDTPIWVGHGTADQINAFEASQLFTQAVGLSDKTFKVYDGGFHKLHGEPGGIKEALAKDVAEWILERCGSPQ